MQDRGIPEGRSRALLGTGPAIRARLYTVTQVARYLKDSLDRDLFLQDLWVSGEISNLSQSTAGHLYFTLKDASSQLRCVMFRPLQGREFLENGAAILAHGRVSFYESRGDLRFYVDLVQPEGVGLLHLELERLKQKLAAEGLFDPARKRPIPRFPRRIGVVTSPTGAVFHDICNIIRRRYPLAELVLAPTPVQGEEAAPGIVQAFRALNQEEGIDVVIVARGGGSLEELWPFNEEVVARAIYGSRAPVISGVGHETDLTIADLVADLRAPTPSAAAEQAVPDMKELQVQILNYQRALLQGMDRYLSSRSQALEGLVRRLRPPDIPTARQRVDDLLRVAAQTLTARISSLKGKVQGLEMQLSALHPMAVLSRGYALVQRQQTGEIISRVGQVRPGQALSIKVSDGSFPAEVTRGRVSLL